MSDSQRLHKKRSTTSNEANERSDDRLDASSVSYIPVPLTSLVGRERDVSQTTQLLQSGKTRLLTLTGPGGVGKTRLALQVAADARSSFADGAYFISLAAISNPDLVLSTIAQTLGVPEAAGQPLLRSLCTALRDKHILLIFDNFEQVVPAGSGVLELLQCSPRLHALVTSRTVLRVYGEQEYPVSPLPLPPDTQDASRQPSQSVEQLARYEAVRLFIERARAVQPEFSINAGNAHAIAGICQRLDGLPLALELAAARTKLLSPQALFNRLDQRLPLLTRGATSLPYRHQTLRDAIDWSYDLLDEDIKRLFRALSVFVGGCTLEAAEVVCGWTTNDGRRTTDDESAQLKTHSVLSPHSSVLDGLAALADRSMLKYEEQEDSEPRFSMLETIREFAMERLEEAGSIDGGEAKDIRRLHAEYYLSLAEEAESHLTAPEQLAWTNRIETEHDNVRAALSTTLLNARRSSDRGSSGLTFDAPHPLLEWTGLRLAGAIWQFWAGRGYLAEGRRWLQLALDAAERLHDSGPDTLGDAGIGFRALAGAQLKALNGMGVLARLAGDFPAARQALEDGLKIAMGISDQRAVASTLNNLGTMAMMRGDYTDARGFLEECLAIKRELGLELEAGHSLTQLGNVAMMEGNYAEARRLHEEGLAIKRQAGDREGIGHSLHSLATIALREGDYAEAQRLNEETLAIARELGNKQGIAYSLRDLGNVECEQGDYEGAHKAFLESLVSFWELENLMPTIECLIGIARVATHTSQAEFAARLFGASHTTMEATEGQLDPPDRAAFERDLAQLRAQLSEEAFTVAWENGKALTLEEAVALALEESPTASPTSSLMAGAPDH